jgi:hypothetical protein
MKHWTRYCRHWGWRIALAGVFVVGTSAARAGDWGDWPVPWPPPGSTNPPPGTDVDPPPVEEPPPGGGIEPPPIDVPPPGGGDPPGETEEPPLVPPPGSPPTPVSESPEPASAVMGLCGLGAGLLAWRRKRLVEAR